MSINITSYKAIFLNLMAVVICPGNEYLRPEDEKFKKLQRENEVLRRERDILKKALAIFSST